MTIARAAKHAHNAAAQERFQLIGAAAFGRPGPSGILFSFPTRLDMYVARPDQSGFCLGEKGDARARERLTERNYFDHA